MDSKITVPKSVCGDEVIDYIANRYAITPQQVISHFMCQDGIITDLDLEDGMDLSFEENEMEILRDMGIRPTYVEFVEPTV